MKRIKWIYKITNGIFLNLLMLFIGVAFPPGKRGGKVTKKEVINFEEFLETFPKIVTEFESREKEILVLFEDMGETEKYVNLHDEEVKQAINGTTVVLIAAVILLSLLIVAIGYIYLDHWNLYSNNINSYLSSIQKAPDKLNQLDEYYKFLKPIQDETIDKMTNLAYVVVGAFVAGLLSPVYKQISKLIKKIKKLNKN